MAPLKIAHRGFSHQYGDNNMESFRKAHDEGFDVIELDIQINREYDVVVYHDVHHNNNLLLEMSNSECKICGIVFLRDVFNEFRHSNITLLLDLKGHYDVVNMALLCVQEHEFPLERLWFCSFNRIHLESLINIPMKITIGFISCNVFCSDEYSDLMKNIDFFSCDINTLSKSLVTQMKEMNKPVFVFTARNNHDIQYIKRFNVDGIISNIFF